MTRTSMAIGAVFGLGFVFAVSVGGGHINAGRWGHAAAAYGMAALCVLGAIREAGRATLPGDYTDDEPAPVKQAGLLARLRAAREARRVTRSMPCDCERYWTTFGREHDEWCPAYYRSIA
ncbi:hypothetical protein [Streptomyces afghaniensis]|uniref:hypothetical protein n=1 Tax=Streptomyces afghaniensis TaxID=66865 RepID=UPI00277EF84C|nr:hypothetical protein [Streptomyces afghaniensis]MDQ1018821.1 hypothetical protein [Streptomyces afghaniensis]